MKKERKYLYQDVISGYYFSEKIIYGFVSYF